MNFRPPEAPTMLAIDRIDLDGGGRKLDLRGRGDMAAGSSSGRHAGGPRDSARIITVAWGDRYIDDLLSITIPALLSPGNLPAFAEHFDSEFVIVTETRFFDKIAAAPMVAQLLAHGALRLLPIDDLLSPWYGVTLTYALARGFADLGAAMVNTHLVFLNADFIVADGSYEKLAQMVRRGERLVVAPSYCAVLEETVGPLRARYEARSCSLTISRRDLAQMVLAHRHNCVRAKTVNQRVFNIGAFDQFYWHVDEHTLLGRQMPIALVYMRPERVVTELPTFWDYGVVAECCPTSQPCVLGDSDDFLMAELRTASTFRERLRLGWPGVDAIALHLSSYATKDHYDFGKYDLVLHSRDLTPHVERERLEFAAFVNSVYDRVAPPMSYRNHPFWNLAFPAFAASRADAGKAAAQPYRPSRALRAYHAFFGTMPAVTKWHPYYTLLRHVRDAIASAGAAANVLLISSGGTVGPLLIRSAAGQKITLTPAMAVEGLYDNILAEAGGFDLCLCDLELDDLLEFTTLLKSLRPWLRAKAKVIVFHRNSARHDLSDLAYRFTKRLFPTAGSSKVMFTGSRFGALALRAFESAVSKGPPRWYSIGLVLALYAPIARLAAWLEERRDASTTSGSCTSMTMTLDLE
jgi:hypothetical protein